MSSCAFRHLGETTKRTGAVGSLFQIAGKAELMRQTGDRSYVQGGRAPAIQSLLFICLGRWFELEEEQITSTKLQEMVLYGR